jgi:hypothetical protein
VTLPPTSPPQSLIGAAAGVESTLSRACPSLLRFAFDEFRLVQKPIRNDGFCGLWAIGEVENSPRRHLVDRALTFVSPITDLSKLKSDCNNKHVTTVLDHTGTNPYSDSAVAKMLERYTAWCSAVGDKSDRLDVQHWMELDDARVFALVHGSTYLMLTDSSQWPIRVYDGPNICHYKSVESFKELYKGKPLTKGIIFGGAHFNALVPINDKVTSKPSFPCTEDRKDEVASTERKSTHTPLPCCDLMIS